MKIEFVSDVACPWCAVGLNSLESALRNIGDAIPVDLHFEPFELNPAMPPEGEDAIRYLSRKYGAPPEQLARSRAVLRERGAAVGFEFGERPWIWNTFDAHRLLHWAGVERVQLALKQALLRAYFSEGRNVSHHDTLVSIAASIGLDSQRATAILETDEFAAQVRADEQFYLRNGITGVPAVILERKHLISGGQPVEVFEQAFDSPSWATTPNSFRSESRPCTRIIEPRPRPVDCACVPGWCRCSRSVPRRPCRASAMPQRRGPRASRRPDRRDHC
jgi:predicted DsbA family dithiol-disulfide isomerase